MRRRRSTADVEYRRARSLFEQQAVTQQRWDQAAAELEAARIGVAQARNGGPARSS